MDHVVTTKVTLTLGAFLGQDMPHVRALAFVTARPRTLEALGRPGDGFLLVGHCWTPIVRRASPRECKTGDVVVSVRHSVVDNTIVKKHLSQSSKN